MELKPEFIASLEEASRRPGGECLCGLVDVLAATSPAVGVRLNPLKGARPAAGLRPVGWSGGHGYWVDGERPRFTFDPAFHQGLYYVQDPSSMVAGAIAQALAREAGRPLVWVDACAAPGGKSTAVAAALPAGSLVVANEWDRKRAEILCENIIKQGSPDVVVTTGDVGRLAKGVRADVVALDVPCSGEGMMRKEPEAAAQWTPGLVASTAALQRGIIDEMWHCLKPGGWAVYSTCTFNTAENEDNLRYLVEELGAEPVDIRALIGGDVPADGAIDCPYPAMRFIPGRVEGEGLFVAVVRKPGELGAQTVAQPSTKRKPDPLLEAASRWLGRRDLLARRDGDRISAVPASHLRVIEALEKAAKVLVAGVQVAQVKGRDLVPEHALAMSTVLNPEAFPSVDVGRPQAVAYLQRQAITLPASAPRGYVLLRYGGCPLGFAKNLGNRANNLYPASWAIRSQHLPAAGQPAIVEVG